MSFTNLCSHGLSVHEASTAVMEVAMECSVENGRAPQIQ